MLNLISAVSFPWELIAALLVLLFMITIHELGHYLVAKLFKFKVNEFAIGMGPAIYKKEKKNGEIFSIRVLPLGGYCAFEGEDEENPSADAFNNKKPWQRILVLIAGATMNFIAAILIFIISISCYGQMCLQSFEVYDSGSQYSLQSEDVILSLNGKDIYISTDLISALEGKKSGDVITAEVYRQGERKQIELKLRCDPTSESMQDNENILKSLGIAQITLINECTNDNKHSLLSGDYLLRVYDGSALVKGDYENDENYYPLMVYENGELVQCYVAKADYEKMQRLYTEDDLYNYLKQLVAGDKLNIFVSRGDYRLLTDFPILAGYAKVDKENKEEVLSYFCVSSTASGYRMYSANVKFGFLESVGRAFVYAFKNVGSTFAAIGQLFTGKLGLDVLSGPVSTVALTSQYIGLGFNYLLEIAGFIGVSLAVFNLLPIPALDGARAVFVLIEWIRKKPVPRKIEGTIHAIGLVLLLMFAVFVDLIKIF